MNFDIESVKQAISAFGTALTFLKQAKDLLPQDSKRQELDIAIESTEKQLKIAEIELAKALGHEICKNHWPSGIMLSPDNKNWKCPVCNNEIKPKPPGKHPLAGRNRY